MEIFEDDVEDKIQDRLDIIRKHGFEKDFENLAFEGGGAKMIAYTGTIQVLEELGILQNVKRLAGTSGGAIAATLLAVGMSAEEMRKLIKELPMEQIMYDSGWGFGTGYLTFGPNIWRKYGWNPGNRFHEKIREILKDQTGNPDITFMQDVFQPFNSGGIYDIVYETGTSLAVQIYKKYKKELCVTATNVTACSPEYFHPKITPDMPVALAVKCSICLPVLMQPVDIKGQLYVDGGVLCNYPVHAFDGWALSMDETDSFFHKLGNKDPFGGDSTPNPKTLGVLVYTHWEDEILKRQLYHLEKQSGLKPKRPDTTLARLRAPDCERLAKEYDTELDLVEAAKCFLEILRLPCVNKDDKCDQFTREEWDVVIKEFSKHPEEMNLLFEDMDINKAWDELKKETPGEMITVEDFISNLQKRGIRIKQMLYGGTHYKPNNAQEFFLGLLNTSMNMSRKVHFKQADKFRTIGIFTDYIYTSDFKVEPGDIKFLVKQGIMGAIAFFEHHMYMTSERLEKLKEISLR